MLAHVLVGEPDPTSPGHVLVPLAAAFAPPCHILSIALSPAAIEVADRLRLFEAVDDIGTR
jgi:hypothetical protein